MNNKWALTALVLTYCVQCSVAASTCEGVTTAVCGTSKTAAEAIDCLKENLGLFRSACGEGMVEDIKRSLKFTERLGGAPFIEAWVKSTDSKAAETPAPPSNSAFQMNLTTFNNTGAVCLDGTPSGYYFRPAPPGSANKDSWVFYMEGGGLCLDFFSCHIRAKSRLGSSNYWDKTHVDGSHTISQDPAINPMFHDWNHVFMPYCTGDVHGGTQVHNNWMGLRFTGHLVVNETLRRLSETSGLSSASNVLLSGQSAGGIGVMLHADYFRTAFPKAHVVAAPEAGFYFPSDVALYEEFIVGLRIPFGPPAALFLTLLYDSYLDESCVAAHHKGELHRCWLASTAVNYIDTPLFLAQNRFDSNQMQFLGLWNKAPRHDAYLEYYGKLALADLHKAAAVPRNGVFMPACFKHTNDLCVGSLTTVNNTRFVDALSTWYTGSAKVAVFDTCSGDLPCNPQCAGPCG